MKKSSQNYPKFETSVQNYQQKMSLTQCDLANHGTCLPLEFFRLKNDSMQKHAICFLYYFDFNGIIPFYNFKIMQKL